jgi:SIR2-like domain
VKKKLLIVLGAGSSVEMKMPSVGAIDQLMLDWSTAWASSHAPSDYYRHVWDVVKGYLSSGSVPSAPAINFERALGELFALANWLSPAPFGNALKPIVASPVSPPGLNFRTTVGFGPSYDLTENIVHLLRCLAAHMRTLSRNLDANSESFIRHRRLLKRLRRAFDVGIYNLNYDNVALAGWPFAFIGFSRKGTFKSKAVHQRKRWGFIYHLHGSVHHSLQDPFGDEIVWKHDLGNTFDDGDPSRSQKDVSEGKRLPKTTLIVGGFKLDQLLSEPFQSFYSSLVRHMQVADAVLFGGYGFGDVHVNQALYNRLHSALRRPRVMILDWGKGKDPMEFRTDFWATELCRNLGVQAKEFSEPTYNVPGNINDLVCRKGFEVNRAERVAIWHGGFTGAIDRIDVIIKWLAGRANNAVLSGIRPPT